MAASARKRSAPAKGTKSRRGANGQLTVCKEILGDAAKHGVDETRPSMRADSNEIGLKAGHLFADDAPDTTFAHHDLEAWPVPPRSADKDAAIQSPRDSDSLIANEFAPAYRVR